MDNYYVLIADKKLGARRELRFAAENFAHAEEQAQPYVEEGEVMISIDLDFELENA